MAIKNEDLLAGKTIENFGKVPPLWTVDEIITFLDKYPRAMEVEFLDKYESQPLHILCDNVTNEEYSGKSKYNGTEVKLTFHLKSNLQDHVVAAAGHVSTEKKAAAARENGKKGGRPRHI